MIGDNFLQEKRYVEAKKRIKQIKAFYIHLTVNIVAVAIMVSINLTVSPNFHWFWYGVLGVSVGTFFHWFAVFGANTIGLGKAWEEKKIREFLEKDNTDNFKKY
ncbi:2TM domain-containing protein [Tenacibaculum sp. SG-28]|uniref:2TM domain-containing protein n=1 Tax=Tenacibaculum sp. SG-28 TaxID=754426 RepID=UPI000CF461C0|nr:2TM domain-containing protein [Tenacibaculum sp. SG-28]PQJ23493.1 histidine kinase [Tenacibaculum sp. SG-28]